MSADSKTTDDNSKVDSLRRHHRAMLALVGIIVALTILLQVRQDQRIEFIFLPEFPLPHTCLSRALMDWNCPLCGLTRSFIFLARGRWADSVGVHSLGWFVALVVVAQIPYRIVALKSADGLPLGRVFPRAFAYTFIGMLFVNWLIGLLL